MGNLAASLDGFVGRRAELAELTRLTGAHRHITLVGPAGAGKTRLAVHITDRLRRSFPDGVWWVDLAAVTDGQRVAHVVMSVLGIPEDPELPGADTVATAIGNRKLLLLLDNCEHLLDDSAPLVEHLLERCPRLRVLATSREALRLAGEQVFAVGELALPEPDTRLDAAEAVRFDAVKLFNDRACAVDRTFALTEDTVDAVVALCHKLDGMPLAIELAARRIPLLTPADILARLDDRLQLLVTGTRTTVGRHRTLGAAIEWSYGLLKAEEQEAWRRLSVLIGPFDIDAAAAACGTQDVLNLLASLEAKSLLVSLRTGGTTMFRQLESIRLFGREMAEQTGDADVARDGIVTWLATLVSPETRRFSPGPEVVLRLDRQLGVLGVAAARTADTGDSRHALIAAAIAWTAGLHGWRTLSTQLLYSALAQPGLAQELRSLLMIQIASNHRGRGDWEVARRFAAQSLAIEREVGGPATLARALEVLASAACHFGDLEEGWAAFNEGLDALRSLDEPVAVARVLNSYSWTALQQGQPDLAAPLVEEALPLIQQHAPPHMTNPVLHTAGAIALARSDFAAAEAMFTECLGADPEHPNDAFYDLEGFALALVGSGRNDERALRLLSAAASIRVKFNSRSEPYWHAKLQAALATTRRRLPAGKVRAAESTGKRMTLSQAIAYALTDRPPNPAGDEGSHITEQERHIAALVATGLTYRQIGQRLGISQHTVARHVSQIRAKLGLGSRAQLAAWAGRHTT